VLGRAYLAASGWDEYRPFGIETEAQERQLHGVYELAVDSKGNMYTTEVGTDMRVQGSRSAAVDRCTNGGKHSAQDPRDGGKICN
jgi:hypothetical protein